MRVFRFIVLSFIIFFSLVTGLSLSLPSHVRVSRAIDISAPAARIHTTIAGPENWRNWMPGAESSVLVYQDSAVNGIQMANGHVLLLTSVTDSTVQVTGKESSSIEASAGWNILGRGEDSFHTLQWYMDFYFDWYPWEKFASLLLESRYGANMEKGLQQLKIQCEQQP